MKKDLDERKRETERLAKLLSDENEKRIRESEAIQQRLEKEKEELRQYLEEDNNKLLQNLKEQAEQHAKVYNLIQRDFLLQSHGRHEIKAKLKVKKHSSFHVSHGFKVNSPF